MSREGQAASIRGDRRALDELAPQFRSGDGGLADHAPRRGLEDEEDRPQVDVHQPVPVLFRQLEQRLGLDDPGVVEEDVEPAPALVGGVHHALDVGPARHVALDGDLPELAGEAPGGKPVEIREHQARALSRQPPRARGADPAGGPRDESDPPVEPPAHCPRPISAWLGRLRPETFPSTFLSLSCRPSRF
jgi:hypothetical protein